MKMLILGSLCLAATAVVGCDDHHYEGPAERAGRHIDNAVDDVRDDARRTERNAREMGRDVRDRLRTDDDTADRYERTR